MSKAHKRKSSTEEEEDVLLDLPQQPLPSPQSNGLNGHARRSRVNSTPSLPSSPSESPSSTPPSAGPYRTSFSVNGPQASPMRQTFSAPQSQGHSRTRTMSGNYAPVLPSPLSESFSAISRQPPPPSPLAFSFPSAEKQDGTRDALPPSPKQNRRHSRIHSRNLSIYFPRLGSIPASVINEDGAQEVEYPADPEGVLIPSASTNTSAPTSAPGGMNSGFTFGGRPSASATSPDPPDSASSHGPSRRGHHHKHSMSHTFFSFLDPAHPDQQPPNSAWNPISPFPQSAGPGATSFPQSAQRLEFDSGTAASLPILAPPPPFPTIPAAFGMAQFILGSALWVAGQQIGSLGCTGLGYWVVFDAFAVGLSSVLPVYLARGEAGSRTRRPYGNGRMETVMAFAQTVYLLFAAVYICKETVEHILLSFGEGHHSGHHHDDSVVGIDYPLKLVCASLFTIPFNALFFESNSKLVNITGNRITSLTALLRPSSGSSRPSVSSDIPTSPIGVILSNPFTIFPLLVSTSIIGVVFFLHPLQHRVFDLILAAVETIASFSIAYPSAVVLGTVLLQTAPPRGLPSGQMESFLRTMREIERHPQIIHLPAPHIWQLTPSPLAVPKSIALTSRPGSSSGSIAGGESFVVALELRVRPDIDDDDVIKLTQWVWERCSTALNGVHGTARMRGREGEDGYGVADGGWGGEADVTVGVVRG